MLTVVFFILTISAQSYLVDGVPMRKEDRKVAGPLIEEPELPGLQGTQKVWKNQELQVEKLVEVMKNEKKIPFDHEKYLSGKDFKHDRIDDIEIRHGGGLNVATADGNTDDGFMLVDGRDGLCAAVDRRQDGENANGAYVYMETCHGGVYQRFYWDGPNIRSKANGLCLTVKKVSNRQAVIMRYCLADAASIHATMGQWWYRYEKTIVATRDVNLCLDAVNGWVSANSLGLYSCHDGPNQNFEAKYRLDSEKPPAYNADEVRMAAQLAAAAYCDENVIQEGDAGVVGGLTALGYTLVRFINDPVSDVQAYVAKPTSGDKTKPVIVGARGTSSLQDAWVDLQFCPVDPVMPDGTRTAINQFARVHLGFVKQYTAMYAAMFDELDKLQNEGYKKILVVGHSLGGALATIAAYDIYLNFMAVDEGKNRKSFVEMGGNVRLITFGSPRIGNDIYVEELNKNLATHNGYRVVNNMDPVPCSPPRWLGFANVHNLLWYDANQGLWRYDFGDSDFCKISRTTVGDHMMDPYRNMLKKLQ